MYPTIKDVEATWAKWEKYKETAEQHEFPLILMLDMKLMRYYKDLHENWNEEHAKIFLRGLENQVFPHFGIE